VHQSNQGVYVGPDFSQAFHTFAVEWQPSQIIWYIDGVERFRSNQGVPSEPMNLIINLAVGGAWPGNPDASTVFPAYLDIDYVSASRQVPDGTPTPTATPVPAPPAAPSGLAAVAASQSQVNLSWTDHSGDESDFHIERSPNGSSSWTQIATVGANVTSYSNTGLTCSTRYYYRVRAHRHGDGQYSPYSGTTSVTTQACSTAPAAPSGLTASASSRSQINLSWADNSSDESDFHIERSPNGTSTWTQVATVGANVKAYSNTGLSCRTRYYYRVRAHRHGDNKYSGYSNVASTRTLACPHRTSAAPFALTAAPASQTEITLSWTNYSNGETGFEIERSPAGADEWMVLAAVEKNVTGYLDGELSCGSIYDYRVHTLPLTGEEQYSDAATAVTLDCEGATHLYLPLLMESTPLAQ
jgi:hypothetical protein